MVAGRSYVPPKMGGPRSSPPSDARGGFDLSNNRTLGLLQKAACSDRADRCPPRRTLDRHRATDPMIPEP